MVSEFNTSLNGHRINSTSFEEPICRPYGADGRGTNTRLFSSNVSCWTPLDVRKGIGLRFRIIFTAVFVPSSAHEPAIPYTNEWRNCPRDLRHPPAEHQGRPENAGQRLSLRLAGGAGLQHLSSAICGRCHKPFFRKDPISGRPDVPAHCTFTLVLHCRADRRQDTVFYFIPHPLYSLPADCLLLGCLRVVPERHVGQGVSWRSSALAFFCFLDRSRDSILGVPIRNSQKMAGISNPAETGGFQYRRRQYFVGTFLHGRLSCRKHLPAVRRDCRDPPRCHELALGGNGYRAILVNICARIQRHPSKGDILYDTSRRACGGKPLQAESGVGREVAGIHDRYKAVPGSRIVAELTFQKNGIHPESIVPPDQCRTWRKFLRLH